MANVVSPHRARTLKLFSLFWLILFIAAVAQSQPAPQQPVEIKVTAKRFEFDPATITVQKGKPVKLVITSADVDHGIKLEEFGVNKKVPAKQTIEVTFTPDKVGRFEFRCSIVCGPGHDDMLGELVVVESIQQKVDVTFDPQAPGVAVVEVDGERYRIDTTTKTWTRIDQPKSAATPTTTQTAEQQKPRSPEAEPYDYRIVNLPTPKRVLKGSLNLFFTHRFAQPVRPLNESARNLIGLDSSAVPSLGLAYGITDKLYVNAYRSAICQRGLCRTIELGVGYHWFDEGKESPIAVSTYASVEGDDNFTEDYTYNLQMMVARTSPNT